MNAAHIQSIDPWTQRSRRRNRDHREILRVLCVVLCALCVSLSCALNAATDSVIPEKHIFTASGLSLPYRLTRPKTENASARFPLVLILHGAGQRGTDNTSHLGAIVHAFLAADIRARFPSFIVAPQCPPDVKWTGVNWQAVPPDPQTAEPTYAMRLLIALVEKLATDLPVDRTRIYVVGVSMGGSGTWDIVTRRPDLFAAALPICGGADAATGRRLAALPVWCFQGAKDEVVRPALSRDMIAAIKIAGGAPRYTEFPESGHEIAAEVFRDPAVIPWLFAQRRP